MPRKTGTPLFLCAVLPGALLLAAALATAPPAVATGQIEAREVKVGILVSLSGEHAALGRQAAQAAELCFEQANSRGGGPRIIPVLADDGGEAALAAAAVRTLVQEEGVSLICGPLSAGAAPRAAAAAQELRVPLLSPTVTHPALTLVGEYIFRACATDAYQALVAATYARVELGLRRAAVLYRSGDESGRTQAEVFRREFAAQGGEITACEAFPPGTRVFTAWLERLGRGAPGLFFLPVAWHEAARIAAQARAAGIDALFLGGAAWNSPDLLKIAPSALEGAHFVQQIDPGGPACRDFAAAYRRYTGREADSVAALTYEAALIFAAAVKSAGGPEPAALRSALAAADLDTLAGRFTFDDLGNPVRTSAVMAVENGRIVLRDTYRVEY